jgi:hypothetical protein
MRITTVIGGLTGGGADRVCANLANAWMVRGRHVTILTVAPNSRAPAYSIDPRVELRDLGSPRIIASRLSWYAYQVVRIWQKWLSRRDRGRRLLWNQFTALRKGTRGDLRGGRGAILVPALPAARIVHRYTYASETLP